MPQTYPYFVSNVTITTPDKWYPVYIMFLLALEVAKALLNKQRNPT